MSESVDWGVLAEGGVESESGENVRGGCWCLEVVEEFSGLVEGEGDLGVFCLGGEEGMRRGEENGGVESTGEVERRGVGRVVEGEVEGGGKVEGIGAG